MKRLYLMIAMLFAAGQINAQYIVKGVVVGKADNAAIPGVTVTVQGTTQKQIAGADGQFSPQVLLNWISAM